MDKVIYAVKCPKCRKKADAVMGGPGVPAGTYREPVHKLRAKLIQCNNCGLNKTII